MSTHLEHGYIAVMSTLIVGAVSLSVAITMLLTGAGSQQNSLSLQRSVQARNLANACAEDALEQIHDNTSYTGSGTLTFGGETCAFTVTNTGTSTRTISTNSTIGGVTRKGAVYVTITSASISVTSWQEVSN